MRFEARGDVHDERAAGAVIHGAIVNTVAVDGRADADVIDVRGKDDEFILERGIETGKFGDNISGFESLGLDDGVSLKRNSQGEMWERLAVLAQRGDFSEGVAGASEKFLRGSGIERDAELKTGSFIEFRIGKIHGRMIAVDGNTRPRNIHGCRIENRDGA